MDFMPKAGFQILIFILLILMVSSLGEEPYRSDPSDAKEEKQVYVVKNSGPKLQYHHEKGLKKRPTNWKMIPLNDMLPKGWVPPSGPSLCHNYFPDSFESPECAEPRRWP
ncbi:hypothetical protein AMTRI_Chr13g125870 [Amborella trichopoda]